MNRDTNEEAAGEPPETPAPAAGEGWRERSWGPSLIEVFRSVKVPDPKANRWRKFLGFVTTSGRAASCNFGCAALLLEAGSIATKAQDAPSAAQTNVLANAKDQKWNWHMQNTDIVQGDFGFPAKYSGPASLNNFSK